MPASSARFEAVETSVARAIERSGTLGITAKQISTLTEIPEGQVSDTLGRLASRDSISRVGRGLWVLRKFEADLPSEFQGAAWYDRAFSKQFRIRITPRPGEIRFNPNERRPVHRWWPYVQGFSAGFVEDVCRQYGIGPGSMVLDPFCGSGTVPLVARSLGAASRGVDMMPITAFVARAKSEWEVDPGTFWRAARKAARARGTGDLPPPFLRETRRQFRPDVLRSLLVLKQNIWSVPEGPVQTLLKLAFSAIIIDASNLKRSPCLGYTHKPGLRVGLPFELFLQACERIRHDLVDLQGVRATWGPPSEITLGDSGKVPLAPASVDLAVTSPPYVNGMDYVTNYKVDLAWMDYIGSYQELRDLRTRMVACDNIPRASTSASPIPPEVEEDRWISEARSSIASHIQDKATYRRDDMGDIVRRYFADLVPVIRNVAQALKPGGRFVVVNGDSFIAGTYVPGDMIFARVAHRLGLEVEAFEVARTRRSGQRRRFLLRETVTTLRRPEG